MIEAGVSAAIAIVAAGAAVTNRVHTRISDMDRRVDSVEIRIAEDYVKRVELSEALNRFEAHMVRIENKLDTIATARIHSND